MSILSLMALFFVASVLISGNLRDFQATVLPTPTAAPYDGLTTPILKVPDWTALSSDQWKLSYDDMPADKMLPFPTYDPDVLKTSVEKLGWKDKKDLAIRNAKITFSTPYMGNYKLDGIENAGSHLAVDIKIPMNTPIYAIGNGVVTKVANQSSGFGKHIVIKHENFPSYDDENKLVTLYSSYNHLGDTLVAEGDVVTKGQLIGKSGKTGTATTPHLHFQIDTSDAPWHPYWPFTFQEATDAGLDFTSAIDAGLGKEKALKVTVNPLKYIQKYLGAETSPSPTSTPVTTTSSSTSTNTSPTPPPVTPDELPPALPNPVESTPSVPDTTEVSPVPTTQVIDTVPATEFKIEHDGSFVENVAEKFTLKAIDADGKIVPTYTPESGVYFQVVSGAANLPAMLSSDDFKNGVAKFEVTPTSDVGFVLKASDNEISGESGLMDSTFFSDLTQDSDHYIAVKFLKKYGVINGYPDGTFRPDAIVSRAEAVKMVLNGVKTEKISGRVLPFTDVGLSDWYTDYVATAYDKNIVKGYPDSTFKPGNTVNRAEFAKMLLLAMDIQPETGITKDVYSDVKKDDWYAGYAKYFKDKKLLDTENNQFEPAKEMSRGEISEAVYRIIIVKISGEKKFTSSIVPSGEAIRKYFK